jgi:mono/diheme cytochrome c family protein
MKKNVLVIACLAVTSVALAYGQAAAPQPTAPIAAQQPRVQAAAAQQQAASSTTTGTAASQKALLDKYCVACHNTKAKATGLDSSLRLTLDDVDLNNVAEHAQRLEKVTRKLRAGMMPPVGMPRPDPATYRGLVTWLQTELDRAAVPHMPPPGLHRLNRTEYHNAIRDLLNLEVDPGAYLPSDDSTSGFDNIAGALGISSTLVEAYVAAAQKISRLAIGEAVSPTLVVYRTPEDTSQNYHIEGLPFGTRGGMLVKHVFPSDGEYRVTITPIFGDNMSPTGFGSVPCERLEVSLDGERLALLDWRGGGRQDAAVCRGQKTAAVNSGQSGNISGARMQVQFKTTAGQHSLGATFLETNFAPVLDLDKQFVRTTLQTGPTPGYTFFPHVGTVRIEGPFNAVRSEDSPSRRAIFICQPKAASEETACARRIITNLATTAFRRPVTAADIDPLMEFYQVGRKGGDFESGIEQALARILASPKFIYRIEEEPGTGPVVRTAAQQKAETYRISEIDLASRLSYFLWSRGPDAELLKLASSGRLRQPAVLEQQVRRMLKDPRAEALTVNFAGQWLNLRGLQAHSPLPGVYPDFDDPLRYAMRREVELLFESVVQEDRSVLDLLTADYTFVNERLARHYGIPNIYGSQFRRITLGPDMDVRKGLLGKAAILTTTAKPERTSPVTRGKWIMTNLLGMSPPDPPPNVPPLPAQESDSTGNAKLPSMRMKMLAHRVRADCTQCHSMMDPIGFSLEQFDGIAQWRTDDNGNPVGEEVTLFDGTKVTGPSQLREWLVKGYSDAFVEVTAEKLLVYALGRGVEYQDMPLVRAIAREAARSNNRFSALVLAVVKSDPFQMNMKVQETAAPRQAAADAPRQTAAR